MAIKYGITLGQGNGFVNRNGNNFNYVNSSGTTIWNGTTNTSYGYDIFGIGQDNTSGLNQKQSRSINGGFQPAICLNNALATNNANNTNTFAADNSYLIAGHNGLGTTYTNSYTPITFSSAPCLYIMDRIWKVQESGTVGNVTVTIPIVTPAVATTTYMVVSNSASFGAGTSEILMTDDGAGNLTAQVDFASGQFFTFVQPVTAPGGVTANLKAWYKANDGTLTGNGSNVDTWKNSATGSSYNVTQATVSQQPKFYNTTASKLLNYNPALEFDGTDELYNLTRLYANTAGFELLGVGKDLRTDLSSTYDGIMGIGADGNYPALDIQTTAGVSPNGWNPWMYTSSPSNEWTGGNAILYNGNLGGSNQQPQIFGLGSLNQYTSYAANRDNIVSNVDGYIENTYLDAYQTAQSGNGIFVGSSGDAEWNGLIPEIIVYDKKLSATELLKVNSYLAIKYGITLDQRQANDYITSDGTSIYAASTFGAYDYDIAGIGMDICSGLMQPKSTSVNEDAVVTMQANVANISNKEFLVWANNNLNLGPDEKTDLPAGLPAYGCPGRVNRIWHIQKTGDVGNVTLSFNAKNIPIELNTNIRLLVRNGSDVMSGATISSIIPTIVGDTIRFANVPFTNNDYFTIAGNALPAPGGVTANLKAWYKADNGTLTGNGSNVTTWTNSVSGSTYNLTSLDATKPKFYNTTASKLVNSNPSVEFTYQTTALRQRLNNANRLYANTDAFELLAVGLQKATYNTASEITGIGVDGNYPAFGMNAYSTSGWYPWFSAGSTPIAYDLSNSILYNGFAGGANQQAQIYGMNSQNGGTDNLYTQVDGYKELTTLDANNQTQIGNGVFVGSSGDQDYTGLVNEVIIYNRKLSATELQKVNSYLAIKYGVTLDQRQTNDYIASDGTSIYAASTAGLYKHDIAGIGQDVCSGLLQLKSTSANEDAVVTMQAIVANVSNKEFLAWANNDLNIGPDEKTDIPSSGLPAYGCPGRLSRIWHVQETGDVGNVTLSFNAKNIPIELNTNIRLLVRNGSAVMSGATISSIIPTIVGDTIRFANVPFSNNDYFTIVGNALPAPGGVTSSLVAWYKANDGTLSGDGSAVTTWTNSANNSTYNVTQATAAYRPTFYNTTANKLLNYNPALEFSFHELANANRLFSNTSGFELLGVAKDTRTTTSTLNGFMGLGVDGNYPALDIDAGWKPWMYVSSPIDQWTGGGAILYNGSNGGANQQPQIFGLGTTNLYTAYNASADNMVSNVDGYSEGTYLDAYRQSEIGNGLFVGSSGAQEWTGLIPEIIVYKRKLSTTDLLKVNSYLAIKYGITLDQRQANDYIASDGSSIYAASTYGIYDNDIAGIGKDECSGLFQPKSTSVNEDAVVTIQATNNANITNKEFLAWANNGLELNDINNLDVPITPYNCASRLSRIWHVQKVGDVGTVTLDFNLDKLPFQAELNEFKLLIRNGSDVMAGATVSPIVPTVIGDSIVRFANVTFNNNDYFTIYGNSITPGGVSNKLVAWYKANTVSSVSTAGTTVTRWKDNYGNRDLVRYNSTSTPTYRTTAPKLLNYNNSIEFDNDAATAQFLYNTSRYFSNTSAFHMISAGKDLETVRSTLRATAGMGDIAAGNYSGLDIESDVTNGWNFVMDLSAPCYYYAQCGTQTGYPLLYNGHTGGTNQQPQLYSVGSLNNATTVGAANNMYTYIDGYKWLTDMDAYQQAPIGKHLYVGSSGGDALWDGLVGEVLIYDGLLTDAEILRINTYLAIKYGITLNQDQYNDYTASNGTIIYAASTYGAFDHDIAGIGLDSCSGLLQPKSTSVNDDAVVTMEATAPFDKSVSFLVWSNNDEDADSDGAKLDNVIYNGIVCADSILDRDWKVQLTNFDNKTKPVNVTFDISKLKITGTDFALLIDTTGNTNYNNAYVILPSSVTSTTVTFNGVTQFKNGAVFTITTYANASIPKLYPYGSEIVTEKCRNGEWIYLRDPSAKKYYLGAIKDSNYIIDLTKLTPKVDVNSAYPDLGDGNASEAVRLMRRMLEINCNNCYNKTTYPDPNFTVRMFFSPAERQTAKDGSGGFGETEYLDVLPPIGGTPELQHWFKVSGLISDILPVPAYGIVAAGRIWTMTDLPTGTLSGINYVDYYDIDSFSVFGYAISKSQSDNSPLPVELLSFYGENIGDNNFLHWQTATELNNWKFIVEHKDEHHQFKPIGEVLGAGTSNIINNYQLVHYSPSIGNNYYRLKQLDFDNTFTYSNTIVINNKNTKSIQVYPNPADNELTIIFPDNYNTNVNAQIVNMLGQVVYEQKWDLTSGKLFKINIQHLPKSTYILKLDNTNNDDKQYIKFNKN